MLISITGPSGVGKGYIKDAILKNHPSIVEIPWVTTRPQRANERNTGNRVSLSKSEFLTLRDNGQLMLAQTLFGHHYGVRTTDWSQNQSVMLTELHIDNLLYLKQVNKLPKIRIAILPSDMNFLRRRLERYRNSEGKEEIEERLRQAVIENQQVLNQPSLFSKMFTVSFSNEGQLGFQVLNYISPFLTERSLGHEKTSN